MLIDYKKANIYQKDNILVLKEVDFHVDEGEFIYVIGRVGAGKSTLLKTLYFELDVDEAENAFVLNHDLRGLKRKYIPALRRQMGIIFQDFQLLSDASKMFWKMWICLTSATDSLMNCLGVNSNALLSHVLF